MADSMSSDKQNGKVSRRAFLTSSALVTTAVAGALASSTVENSLSAATAASGLLSAPMINKGARKRNVLFISTDDMCNRLGCYGVPVIKSPNLDRLAQSGVRFDHHYCQFPLCDPSRSSLMTGFAPDTTGVLDLNTDFRDTMPQAVTISQLFQKNGYFSARAGKIYHYNNPSEIGTAGFDDAASWQRATNPAGYDRTHDEALVTFFSPPERMYKQFGLGNRTANPPANGGTAISSRAQSKVRWLHGGGGPSGIRIAQDGCTPILPQQERRSGHSPGRAPIRRRRQGHHRLHGRRICHCDDGRT